MLDLKSMQEAGEEIHNIPMSDEEMKYVVESAYGEFPEVEGANLRPADCERPVYEALGSI